MPELLICGSSILLAGVVGQETRFLLGVLLELILWEFDKDSNPSTSSWKDIVRMPLAVREVYAETNIFFDLFHSVAVGDSMCFTCDQCLIVAVYNLSEETWSWLPMPTSKIPRIGYHCLMAFKPRLDIKFR